MYHSPTFTYSVQHSNQCGAQLGDTCCGDSQVKNEDICSTAAVCDFGLLCEMPISEQSGTCACTPEEIYYCPTVCETYEQNDLGCDICKCKSGKSRKSIFALQFLEILDL